MRKIMVLALLMMFLATACSGKAAATSSTTDSTTEATTDTAEGDATNTGATSAETEATSASTSADSEASAIDSSEATTNSDYVDPADFWISEDEFDSIGYFVALGATGGGYTKNEGKPDGIWCEINGRRIDYYHGTVVVRHEDNSGTYIGTMKTNMDKNDKVIIDDSGISDYRDAYEMFIEIMPHLISTEPSTCPFAGLGISHSNSRTGLHDD